MRFPLCSTLRSTHFKSNYIYTILSPCLFSGNLLPFDFCRYSMEMNKSALIALNQPTCYAYNLIKKIRFANGQQCIYCFFLLFALNIY